LLYSGRQMAPLYAVIMAGGAGTRFWPASRSHRPKQLLPLASATGEPLVATSVRRILPLCPPERIYVVTAQHLTAAMQEALPGIPTENFLSEPAARNTAPCIGWANAVIAARAPDAKVMVLASDHFIADEDAFRQTVATAVAACDDWNVVTIGITPTRPETGYGYIEKGRATAPNVFAVERFVEKPNTERALGYLASGHHLWNSGMFFFRASAMARLIDTHAPALAEGLAAIARASSAEGRRETLQRVFPELPSISIDHAIMERAQGIAVVPGSFGWSDVGSWQSSWELSPKDANENAAPEGSILIDARGNLVSDLRQGGGAPGDRLIALIGVDNLAVVVTDDVVLVIPREKAQDVRKAVDLLKSKGTVSKL
jgi:mannose-1-phosphate guanylyltransferase